MHLIQRGIEWTRLCAQRLTRDAILREARSWATIGVGFFLFALAIVLRVQAGLGPGPWDVFHVGLSSLLHMSLGRTIQLVGIVVIGASYLFARIKPGWGTLGNMVFIGMFTDWVLPHVPRMTSLPLQLPMLFAGVFLTGPATAIYFSAGLGAGPRDSLMLALSRLTHRSIRSVRIAIEITVLIGGLLMGGTVGLGTVVTALASGPVIQWSMRVLGIRDASRRRLAEARFDAAPIDATTNLGE